MPTFEYEAQTATGSLEKGSILGSSLENALQQLTTKGLRVEKIQQARLLNDPLAYPQSPAPRPTIEAPRVEAPQMEAPTKVKEEAPPHGLGPRPYYQSHVVGQLVGRVDIRQLAFFFRQFSAMENSGVPMASALETLSKQSQSGKLRLVVHEMSEHVAAGRPASFGMQRYPEVFTPLAISLIRAGEAGGYLSKACMQVADYLDEEIELRNLYRKITFYPKLTLGASIVLFAGANGIIAALGKKGGLSSPLTEPVVWMILGPIILGIFLFLRVGLANSRIRQSWDAFILMIPWLGGTLKNYSMAKFGRAFGALYGGGVAAHESLRMAADACGNEHLRARMYPAIDRLSEGAALAPTFATTGAFNPIVLDMLATGESSGSVEGMLGKMADYYEDDSKVRAEQLAHVTGVVILIIVAIYVFYLLYTFYTGYFAGIFNSVGPMGGE